MVSPVLPSQFAQRVIDAIAPGQPWEIVQVRHASQGVIPTAEQLASLLDTAFFASTSVEEGRQARFSIAIRKPSRWGVHRFVAQEAVSVEAIAKLSAACHADATALQAAPSSAGWMFWGIGVNVPPWRRASRVLVHEDGLVLTARDAGVLTLRSYSDVLFHYERGTGMVLDKNTFAQDLIAKVLSPGEKTLQVHHLSAIARAMRAHTRGGTLLVVPQATPANITFRYPILQERIHPLIFNDDHIVGTANETEIVAPLAEATGIENAHSKRARMSKQQPGGSQPGGDPFELHGIDWTDTQAAQIGRLTAVDGIVALNHEMSVIGFGGKVPIPDGFASHPVLHVDSQTGVKKPTIVKQLFSGMRHMSAAAACAEHGPGALAMVQSQDGAMTIVVAMHDSELWAIRPLHRLIPTFER